MLKHIILIVAIFIIILLALTFGETVAQEIFAWISALSGLLIRNFGDLFAALLTYLQLHTTKVLLALVLTIPISIWILKSRRETLSTPSSQRKIAIVLAVFLGWLGAHRFYLGQIGWGVGYLILFYVFTPLALILALIDAVRYLFMDDETFSSTIL
ncbi:TM2 domain-containing protein [Alcaligenaceae bacterium CGII-47]|nr:TM2 domain-containing protein [Alcaligenaceae bacterium CGII-47]